MRILVVYDSVFGNTEKVAQRMGEALSEKANVIARRVGEVAAGDLQGLDLLLVGSPTRAFSATPAVKTWLKSLPKGQLIGVKVAAFDTRMNVKEVNNFVLTQMVKIFGYAAEPISKQLVKKGGTVAIAPEGFFVEGSEGPMKEGEMERAADWACRAAQ